jgi:hypothetical protein
MCFRPPTVGKSITCPQCGAVNPGLAKNCTKCKADLTKAKEQDGSKNKE